MEMYLLQPSFAGGEISSEVANRVDIEKYQSALLNAENVVVKPYGGIAKRQGTEYVGMAKYGDKKCILVEFAESANDSYMLEVGEKYIRVWKDGVYLGVELVTPFAESDLPNLRFNQSADVMYICSGAHPVQELRRHSLAEWTIGDILLTSPYFDISQGGEAVVGAVYNKSGEYTFVPSVSGKYKVTVCGAGGGGVWFRNKEKYADGGYGERIVRTLELQQDIEYSIVVGAKGDGVVADIEGAPIEQTYTASTGGASVFGSTVTSAGGGGASGTFRLIDFEGMDFLQTKITTGENAGNGQGSRGGYVEKEAYVDASDGSITIEYTGNRKLIPSATKGTVTVTASVDVFSPKDVGAHLKLSQELDAQTASLTVAKDVTSESKALLCGQAWKVLSHGKWGGTITILQSEDGVTWKEYRKYTGKYADGTGDLNVSESGTFEKKTFLKLSISCNGGTCECDLSVYGYTHEGYGRIVAYTDPCNVTVDVIEAFGSTDATSDYAFDVWNDKCGYPSCSAFFQDRLCFAGNDYYPHSVWMSRTGDYYNFSVEKASGTVTDDSAVMASLISRKMYKINHLVPGQDLAVLTNGNEWIISGGDVVTPANINPKMQTTRGSNECEPLFIGSRVIYVQRRGGTVRDMGYSFETDNYAGDDLTQLAKHLVNGYDLTDSAYCQEPYSIVHFVRSDGALIELTYIREQNVYAWAHSVLGGTAISVCAVPSIDEDVLYVALQREVNGETKTYIERMAKYCVSEDVMDYTCMDSSVKFTHDEAVKSVSAEHLAGMTVQVMADGRRLPDVTVAEDGTVALISPAKRIAVGLPILMTVELPNVEAGTNNGTMQGRKKDVKEVFLRLERSLGGRVGQRVDALDMIQYDELYETGAYPLYTGDKHATVPVNFNDSGRVIIEHDEPMPFSLCSIVRKVQFGG